MAVAEALARFESIAAKHNQRSVKLFVADVRAKFEPLHETYFDPDGNIWDDGLEGGLQKPGYTIEGAIAREVYKLALNYPKLELSATPTAAEAAGQTYHKTPESLIDELLTLEGPPYTEDEIAQMRKDFRSECEQQARDAGFTESFDLPEDLFAALRIARYVNGPGLPFYNGFWSVITGIWIPKGGQPPDWRRDHLKGRSSRRNLESVMICKIGDQHNSIRNVFYFYARPLGCREQDFRWYIMDQDHAEIELHSSLTQYIDSLAKELENELELSDEDFSQSFTYLTDSYPVTFPG